METAQLNGLKSTAHIACFLKIQSKLSFAGKVAFHVLLLFLQLCIIAECGELKEGDNWGLAPMDGSGDTHTDFPEDSDVDLKDVSISSH